MDGAGGYHRIHRIAGWSSRIRYRTQSIARSEMATAPPPHTHLSCGRTKCTFPVARCRRPLQSGPLPTRGRGNRDAKRKHLPSSSPSRTKQADPLHHRASCCLLHGGILTSVSCTIGHNPTLKHLRHQPPALGDSPVPPQHPTTNQVRADAALEVRNAQDGNSAKGPKRMGATMQHLIAGKV